MTYLSSLIVLPNTIKEAAKLGILIPRAHRYSLLGAIHHVMLRGNQGRLIFYLDGDRVQWCLLIQEGIERFAHRIHGFA